MVRQTIDLVGPKGWILHAVFKDIQVKEKTLDRAMSRLEELEPTLFLIDFSQIKPDEVFLNRSEGTNSNFSSLSKGLSDFCQWVTSHKHRVIIGLPRFLLALADFENLVQNISRSWSYISAELFSHEHRWRADYCQELLRDIPLPNILRPLVSANSNALSHAVVYYILKSKRSGTLLPARADDFSGLVTLINLAKNLIDDGFGRAGEC